MLKDIYVHKSYNSQLLVTRLKILN